MKLLLLLLEKGSPRESASNLKLYDLSHNQQATTLGENGAQNDRCSTT